MSLAAEIAWNLMPPLTFGTGRVVISCVLAPAYDVGGDSFDYAVSDSTAHLAVFDAMGHGLTAGLVATVAVAAYRRARRTGLGLAETAHAIDAAVAETFPGEQYATGLLAELILASGELTWHAAGHPPPLVLRGGKVVKTLEGEPGLPFGIAAELGGAPSMQTESLEPGDRVLMYSDGVVEARAADGEFFGTGRLGDLASRQAAAGQLAPETMRGLMHAVLDHQAGALQDDATMVLLEWQADSAQHVIPESAP
jgi:serine phosphatase RsbU (regulator of sigma subunit)